MREVAADAGVAEHVVVRGRASNLVFATLDAEAKPSQDYRTLFLRQLITGGVIGPSFVVSAALTDTDMTTPSPSSPTPARSTGRRSTTATRARGSAAGL